MNRAEAVLPVPPLSMTMTMTKASQGRTAAPAGLVTGVLVHVCPISWNRKVNWVDVGWREPSGCDDRGARRTVTGEKCQKAYCAADHDDSFDLVDHGC
jgi:hypothetical protein